MSRALLVAALIVPLAFVPTAAAHECPTHDDALRASGFYVVPTPGVYRESNGVAGLQSTAGSCTDDHGREFSWAADTRVL